MHPFVGRQLKEEGFEITKEIFSGAEVDTILGLIDDAGLGGKFGVREVLFRHSAITERILPPRLRALIARIIHGRAVVIKSIYFDKPPNANWIVNWHQDLTINVTHERSHPGYKNWRGTAERTVVQPPRALLESM